MARTHAPGRPGITARLTTQPRVDPEIPCRSAGEIPNAGKERAVPRLSKTPRWSAVRRTGLRNDRCVLRQGVRGERHAPLRRSAPSLLLGVKKDALRALRSEDALPRFCGECTWKRRPEGSGGKPAARAKRLGCLTIGPECSASEWRGAIYFSSWPGRGASSRRRHRKSGIPDLRRLIMRKSGKPDFDAIHVFGREAGYDGKIPAVSGSRGTKPWVWH